MGRLEEIHERLQGVTESSRNFIQPSILLWYGEDIPYLLERVEELERERKLMLDHMARNGHLGPGGGW